MEFKKVTIKNYRIHKELIIDFNENLTLIGGDNEKGKSTIAEAIHRALFFKANGSSVHHKSMKSTLYDDDPEVELIFLSKGKEFKLSKKFGTRGGVTLSEASMTALTGEAAETMLASLIQTETNVAGNNLAKKWPLLWVWQGVSGDNPVTFVEDSQQKLIQRLQTYGASTVLSSKFDKDVSDAFAQEDAANYNNNNTVKAGSALKKAEDELADVTERLEQAREKVKNLEEASENYEKFKLQLEKNQEICNSNKLDEEALIKRLENIKELEANKQLLESSFQIKKTSLDSLLKIQEDITNNEEEIKRLTEKLEPLKKIIIAKKAELAEFQDSAKDNNNKLVDFRKEEDSFKHTIEICKIVQEITALKKSLVKLNETKQHADAYIEQIATAKSNLAKLVTVTSSQIQELQNKEVEIGKALSKLEGISTSIEVLNSKEDIFIDGEKQVIGTKNNFSEKFEVKVGANTTILITPGGGASLADAKSNLHNLQESLQSQLTELGFVKVEEAIDCLRSREEYTRNIENLEKSLKILNANDIVKQIADTENEIGIKDTLLVKKGEMYLVDIKRYNAENVSAEISENESKSEAVSSQIKTIDEMISGYNTKIDKLSEEIKSLQDEIDEDDRKLNSNHSTLVYILGKEGDKQSIENKIKECQALVDEEKVKLDNIVEELEQLSPDTADADKARITRALDVSLNNLTETKNKLITLEVTLTNNGTENPNETLNKLEEKYNYTNDTHRAALQKAKAIKKLHELFNQEQQQLADKLTKPLAEKIEYYLKPVFGPSVSVTLKQEAGQFKEFLISRDKYGTFNFEALSGGTKEQFSAAVRLAMAEVLSADFDNKLPIVFDDAFTNSDKTRILEIQPMLDRASQKGVQVIVLTCHPDAYAKLGVKEIELN